MIAAVKAVEFGRAWRLCRIWPTEGRSSLAGRGLAGDTGRLRRRFARTRAKFVGGDIGQARRRRDSARFRTLDGQMEIELSGFRPIHRLARRRSFGLDIEPEGVLDGRQSGGRGILSLARCGHDPIAFKTDKNLRGRL